MEKSACREAIAAHRRGERPHCDCSMFREPTATPCSPGGHRWRTIACADDRDLDECSVCGQHAEHACNFDDEYN